MPWGFMQILLYFIALLSCLDTQMSPLWVLLYSPPRDTGQRWVAEEGDEQPQKGVICRAILHKASDSN